MKKKDSVNGSRIRERRRLSEKGEGCKLKGKRRGNEVMLFEVGGD